MGTPYVQACGSNSVLFYHSLAFEPHPARDAKAELSETFANLGSTLSPDYYIHDEHMIATSSNNLLVF